MKTQAEADNRIQLWLAPVKQHYDAATLAAYETLLSAEERARWRRFLYPEDRQRFLVGRAFLRTVLADRLGHADPGALQFARLPHGKPALAGIDAGKLQFNLSHTDAMLVLAVSPRHPVGVDVEAMTRKVEMLALARRYFARHEYEALAALDSVGQRERFFALWTLKEAWLKARGLGLRIPLQDFSFVLGGEHPVIEFGPQLVEDCGDWQFRQLAQDEFRIALAVHRPVDAPVLVQVHEWAGALNA